MKFRTLPCTKKRKREKTSNFQKIHFKTPKKLSLVVTDPDKNLKNKNWF